MSDLELFDPGLGPRDGWPRQCLDRAYLEAFAHNGSTALITNLRTQVRGLRSGERVFPVTINGAEYGDAYVCLPHTAYALYAKEELRIVNAGPMTPALALVASGAGALLRSARVNRIVHVNNYMLSTNLHGGWDGEDVGAIRDFLVEQYPDHLIAVRSLNDWSDAPLCRRFSDAGWKMLPSRQIYVTEDMRADWAPHRDTRRDLAIIANVADRIDPLRNLRPGDAEKIAQLYAMLYLDRYSKLNPAFTAAYVEMTHNAQFFHYRGLRDDDGALSAIVGCFIRGGVLTTPIVGYDTTRPASEGLYRIASAMLAQMAIEHGCRLNGSAGAADFKRNRGARAVIEYSAYFVDHLSFARRATIGAIERLLNKVAVPVMLERGL
ncbi:MAG: GNAT family N-acetyltransferase [Alphaproteobacteria bacterium]|nr:GNAT family N-acetyltransferase [Alphaproteobacteria bacterium]